MDSLKNRFALIIKRLCQPIKNDDNLFHPPPTSPFSVAQAFLNVPVLKNAPALRGAPAL